MKTSFGLAVNADNAETCVAEEMEYMKHGKVEEKRKAMNSSVHASSSLDVRHYLESPPPDGWMSPLPFGEKHKAVLPDIYKLQKNLCLPATFVPSERLFSAAGLTTNDRRNRLDPKNLNNILFLHSNI